MGSRFSTVLACAKVNLSLKVLHKRPDGYHELRTILQTISLADRIRIECRRAKRTTVEIESSVAISDNLAARAARAVLDEGGVTAAVRLELEKHIPMGAGLGGGSSDAAAVLLALPVLLGFNLPLDRLTALAAGLGSDVPFFLYGGSALGIGRGTELYPLPGAGRLPGMVISPDVHVSTAEAYAGLGPELTSPELSRNLNVFQSLVWGLGEVLSNRTCENDFEVSVFRRHPRLEKIKRKLLKEGADPAMMTGSGAAMFGLFANRRCAQMALQAFPNERVFPIHLVSSKSYRALWRRSLQPHITGNTWPLQSRYAR